METLKIRMHVGKLNKMNVKARKMNNVNNSNDSIHTGLSQSRGGKSLTVNGHASFFSYYFIIRRLS